MSERKLNTTDARMLRMLADRYFDGTTTPAETAMLVGAARDLPAETDPALAADIEVIGRIESGLAAMAEPEMVSLPGGLEERLTAHVHALACGRQSRRRPLMRRVWYAAASVAALALAVSAGWFALTDTYKYDSPADGPSRATASLQVSSDTVTIFPAAVSPASAPVRVADAGRSSATRRRVGRHNVGDSAGVRSGKAETVTDTDPAVMKPRYPEGVADPEIEQLAEVESSVADAGMQANNTLLASLDRIAEYDNEVENVIARNIDMIGSAMRDTQSSIRQASAMISMASARPARYDVADIPTDGVEPTDPFDF